MNSRYIRNFREGDKKLGAEVESAAGEFTDLKQEIKLFETYTEELRERLLILENSKINALVLK